MSQILITGGTGFLGSNTARAFAAAGIPVVVTTRKEYDPVGDMLKAESDLITVEQVDFLKTDEVTDLFARYQFEGMVMTIHTHQYARCRADNNAIYPITLNCLEAAENSGVKRVVFASSMAMYAGTLPPLTEDMAFTTEISFEGEKGWLKMPKFEAVVKRATELIALDYGTPMGKATSGVAKAEQRQQMEVVALRFPIQWGPGYTALGNPYSLACHTAAGRIDTLKDRVGYFNLPIAPLWNALSLTPTAFIKDSASVVLTVMQAEKLPNRIYNVSSGFTTSPRKQLEALYNLVPECRERIGIMPEDLLESHRETGFNSNRLKADFGWESSYTLESAYEAYIAWLQDHPL